MFENINALVFEKEMEQNPDAVILDVRSKWEFESGHIPGAKHLDFFSPYLEAELNNLERDKYYLVYCRSGARSYTACNVMANMGFKKLANMMGGLIAWRGEVVTMSEQK